MSRFLPPAPWGEIVGHRGRPADPERNALRIARMVATRAQNRETRQLVEQNIRLKEGLPSTAYERHRLEHYGW